MKAWQRLAGLPAGRITKWLVVAAWVLLIGGVGQFAAKIGDVQNNDSSTWLPTGSESTRALALARQFPGNDTVQAIVVYARDGGITAADRAKASADRVALRGYAHGQVGPLVPARDGAALLVAVPLPAPAGASANLLDSVTHIRETVQANAPPGLAVKVTGTAGTIADFQDAFSGLDTTLLFVTVGVVALVLLITYRSPILWLLPLLCAGVAGQLANAAVYLLARYAGLTVNGQSAGILTVLVFGAGTDYALLLVARYREELRRHTDRHAAMAAALRRSLPALVASATTVALGMLCLLVAQMNNLRGLGPVAATGIVVAFVSMTTLLPALLVVFGRWLFWPFVPRFDAALAAGQAATAGRAEHGVWGRIAGAVGRRPRLVWTVAAVGLGALALGTTTLQSSVGQRGMFTHTPESVQGQAQLTAHYPAGTSAPAEVYARVGSGQAVAAAVSAVPGVARIDSTRTAGDRVQIRAVLAEDPGGRAAERTVRSIRDAVHPVAGADAVVGGPTAMSLDSRTAVGHDERLVIPLVLLVVLCVLMLLLRAVVAPLLLLASVALSFVAALGGAALLYHAFGHPGIDLSLPLMGFLFLVALGVDYTIFLMTRAREEIAADPAPGGHRRGMLRALTVTGGVITSAGVVLAATFSVLAVLPVVTMLQMGLLVTVGVLLDTLVVRTLLVPALTLDVGRRTWWPGRLARPAVPPGAVRDLAMAGASQRNR
jgi:RND superfamily putative drug exporter